MTQDKDAAYARLLEIDKEGCLLEHVLSLLRWDQETYMPSSAAADRAKQISLLSGLHHEKVTSPELGQLLDILSYREDAQSEEQRYLRLQHRLYQQRSCLPKVFVQRFAEQSSAGMVQWRKAREDNNFQLFLPNLDTLVQLNQEMAEYIGYEEEPYDALLGLYEPDMKTATVGKLFSELQEGLKPILHTLYDRERKTLAVFEGISQQEQQTFHKRLLQGLQFDTARARLDISAHPFTTTLGSHDVRITTRYDSFLSAIFSTLHEYGHALYELSFLPRYYGTSMASGTSLMVHESQSRFWENIIGRSSEFWHYWYPILLDTIPVLADISINDFLAAVNTVEPNLIRVASDEVSYNMHIILRFTLERDLIQGTLAAKDVPEVWCEHMKELLGVVPQNYAEGVLQDIHWSEGMFGYFPTYALGNLFAAQLYNKLSRALPVPSLLRAGSYEQLIQWLSENVHQFGSSKTATEIVHDVTGEDLQVRYFIAYIRERYAV